MFGVYLNHILQSRAFTNAMFWYKMAGELTNMCVYFFIFCTDSMGFL